MTQFALIAAISLSLLASAPQASAKTTLSLWTDPSCKATRTTTTTIEDGTCNAGSSYCSIAGIPEAQCATIVNSGGLSSFKTQTPVGGFAAITPYNCTGCVESCRGTSVPLPCDACINTGILVPGGTGTAAAYLAVGCPDLASATSTSTSKPNQTATGNSAQSAVSPVIWAILSAAFALTYLL
ncbi:hypothetical protein BC831DRAFT_476106 [Entophlyctis helioformis]|nr:hypothetical protein BC831DRAFT_476106 [Entophlyctis helioformis]